MVDKKLPSWVPENIPRELVESTLFRFNIKLQAIEGYVCCGDISSEQGICSKCGKKRKAKNRRIKIDMLPVLDLDYDLLEQQMQDLPAQYAFWAAVYSEARLQVGVDERYFKATKGRIIETTRDYAKDSKVRLTAEEVKAVVEAHEDTAKADLRLQQSQMRCGKLYHMLEALKMKAELGRSLAGFKRQEMERA